MSYFIQKAINEHMCATVSLVQYPFH